MPAVEIWLDLMLTETDGLETVATLFARHDMPVIPGHGEAISYMQAKGSSYRFEVVGPRGARPQHILSTTVAEVRHHASRGAAGAEYVTAIHLEPVLVASLADAQAIAAFLTSQLSFEFDPYGPKSLQALHLAGA